LLEKIVQEYAIILESLWNQHSKYIKITKDSKAWWNKECNLKLNSYCAYKSMVDWKEFKEFVKKTKRSFFNKKIQEIVSKNKRPWDLMNWVKKHKLLAIKAIQFNGQLCIEHEDLWNALYHTFNSTQNQQINASLLDEIPMKLQFEWPLFSKM